MESNVANAAVDILTILIVTFTFGALVGRMMCTPSRRPHPLPRYKSKPFKEVSKPWGREVWLELNDKYCYKRLYIKAGTRTSYQYHEKKSETNYVIKGQAEVWLENNSGVVEKFIVQKGDFFNATPPKKHRVIAITDIILQEVSTPEVDDVVRLQDDTERGDGRIESEHH
jgi:mannose-6-phosphate isomerase